MNIFIKTLLILSVACLVGCAHKGSTQGDFMKNTPEQMKIGKLPYSNEVGLLYEV